MVSAVQAAEITQGPPALGIPGVEEPTLIQYEDRVWSCGEKREIRARLYYSVTAERDRHTYRLLFIEPLI